MQRERLAAVAIALALQEAGGIAPTSGGGYAPVEEGRGISLVQLVDLGPQPVSPSEENLEHPVWS